MKTYVVTGGLGFIGYHLCKRLLEDGHYVYSVDNKTNKNYNEKNEHELSKYQNFRSLEDDIRYLHYTPIIGHADGIFHLAALPRVQLSFDNPIDTNETNIQGTLSVLEFAKKNKIPRVVFASSSTAKTVMSPYGIQKKTGELYMDLYSNYSDISTISLRYHSVYGPNMNAEGGYALLIPKLIHCGKTGEPFTLYGTGENKRDFTFIDDVIDATILAMNGPQNGVYEIGCETPISINDVITTTEKLFQTRITIKKEPERIEPTETKANTLRFKIDFGWKPTISFYDGLKKCIEE